jgi:hypothetical protein
MLEAKGAATVKNVRELVDFLNKLETKNNIK